LELCPTLKILQLFSNASLVHPWIQSRNAQYGSKKTRVNLLRLDQSYWHQWDSYGLHVMPTSLANHPCKHLGTGPGVVKVARHSSCHVEASSTRIPTSLSIPLPHTRADSTTPSSSSWHPSNKKNSLRNKWTAHICIQNVSYRNMA
jgi:hypothetical protein